ncbi:MAG TPA: hypothetical protein VF638_02625 [Sphingomonas sp.]|jgi:hypothetical protein
MATILNITEILNERRKARRLTKDVQWSELRIAHGLLLVTEREVRRQMMVLCDQTATKDEVEEAIELMPLLTEILLQRQRELRCMEIALSEDKVIRFE